MIKLLLPLFISFSKRACHKILKSSERGIFILLFVSGINLITEEKTFGQEPPLQNFNSPKEVFSTAKTADGIADLYQTKSRFISNIGQYRDTLKGYGYMGKILFGYEGLDMPVLFTEKGMIHLQRKIEQPSEEEREEMERDGKEEEEVENEREITERVITMQWLSENPDVKITAENLADGYQVYGFLPDKAFAFKKITYKEIYAGVDLVYTINENKTNGFEYSLMVKPNTDLSIIKMKFGGDVKNIRSDENGNLIIKSDINGITESIPVSYYADENNSSEKISSSYLIKGKEISFELSAGYDKSRSIIIDPFISATTNLTGANLGKAKDVDFDYAGNVFVTGGGDGSVYKLSKFNSAGVLQWTFSGALAVPAWTFGPYYGGWVVEKSTGNVYLGHGFNPATGYQVIRLNPAGLYDNYISTPNVNANENWKMFWSCNNGNPQILVSGGGTSGNLNLGILAPPSTNITGINISNIATGCCQDVVDMVYDPNTFDIYPLYASLGGTPFLNNRIYKNSFPYGSTSVVWNTLSGYTPLSEANNRPYMVGVGLAFNDNSANMLAINSSYLFYYDGLNLKAFNKTTGAVVGTPIIVAGSVMMEGGIDVDECNNVFVGSINGTVKVYQFNGTTFNDAAAPDITITGFTTKSIYDLVINDGLKLLYVSGDGFVSSFDINSYGCGSNTYTISVITDCVNHTAVASLSPAPPANSTITYVLYNGATQIASNTNGNFSGLTPNLNYTIHAFVNQACSGIESVTNFSIIGPGLSVTGLNTTCGLNAGSITATGTGGVAPLTYSIDGTTFQGSGNFTGLGSGIYTVTVKDVTGCASTSTVNIVNSNGPTVTLVKTDAFCGTASGTITATGASGTSPYQYSLNGGAFQSSNLFSSLASGVYLITVKDATGCLNTTSITLISIGNTTVGALPIAATCGNSNGSITAIVTGGTPPYLYSINGTVFQIGDVFTGLAPGAYTLTVKDASNCINFITVTISNVAGPQISAVAVPTSCNSFTGTVTVTAAGVFPMQYSINNGTSFQTSNIFNTLSAGTYSVVVKDANGCLNTTNVIVNLSIPQVTGSSTQASCALNDGTITAIGTGGIPPYQYSINGTTFQTATLFSGLGSGSYTLTIKDAVGCLNSISPIIINNVSGLSIAATSTTSSCVSPTGTITATGSGGQAPLQYSINGVTYQSSNSFTSLAAGNYSVTVKDANNCISTMLLTVNSVNGPSVSATATSTSCNSSTGIITAIGSSGTAPYTFSKNGTTFQSSNIFSGLAPGSYTITIKDANLCTATVSIVVTNVGGGSGPSVTATAIAAECGQSNGKINGNGSGGQNPKQYSLDGINWQGSTNFNNLPPGNYTLYVHDANGCLNFVNVTVPNFAGPQVTAVTTPSICGGSTGSITCTGFGGTAPYRFSIDGGVNFAGNGVILFTGLASGYYTIMVRDAPHICENSIVVYIGNSNGPAVSFTKIDASCSTNNATITATGTGGTPPLTYSLDGVNFQSSNLFTGLGSGQFILTIKDATGCANSSTVTINSLAVPQVAVAPVSATCNNNNGSITVTGTSGVTPYQYSLDGVTFQSGNNFSGLAPGSYSITLKDANNCLSTTNATLSNIPGPQLAANAITSCAPSSGVIIITGSNGTLPYSYSINGTTFQSSFVFSGMAGGNYTTTIKDANGCLNTASVTVIQSSVPSAPAVSTITQPTCGVAGNILLTGLPAGTWTINPGAITGSTATTTVTGLVAGTYNYTISNSAGCISASSVNAVINVQPITPSAPVVGTITQPTCLSATGSVTLNGLPAGNWIINPGAITGSTVSTVISNLSAGTYNFTVTNAVGCTSALSSNIIINAQPVAPIPVAGTITQPDCVTPTGSVVLTGLPIGTWTINPGAISGTGASTTISNLISGTYNYTVTTAAGCISIPSADIIINTQPPQPLTPIANAIQPTCLVQDGSIELSDLPSTGTWIINPGGITGSGTTFTITPVTVGTYDYTVTNLSGCTSAVSNSVTINIATGGTPGLWIGVVSSDWNDPANWCAPIPTPTTDVTIPAGTPFYPDISNTGIAYCKNLTIDAGAALSILLNGDLKIYGNLTVNGTYIHPAGVVEFTGTVTQTTDAISAYDVLVNTTGGVILNGDLTITHSLTLSVGIIHTGTFKVDVTNPGDTAVTPGSFTSYVDGYLRRAVTTSGNYDFPVGDINYYQLANINFINNPDVDSLLVNFNSTSCGQDIPNSGGGPYMNGTPLLLQVPGGYWTVKPNFASTNLDYTASMYKQFINTGAYFNDPNFYSLIKRNDCSVLWLTPGVHINSTQIYSTVNGNLKQVKCVRSGLVSFSDFDEGFGGSTLPIQLSAFTANYCDNNQNSLLSWTTLSELNCNYFELEVATDITKGGELIFRKIGMVSGHGTSLIANNYSYTDKEINKSGTRYYRLKEVDFDGTFTYSQIQSLDFVNAGVALTTLYPNPTNEFLNFDLTSTKATITKISITNLLGEEMVSKQLKLSDGKNTLTFNVHSLSSGIYFINIIPEGKIEIHRKFEKYDE